MDLFETFLNYSERHRGPVAVLAAGLILLIAFLDWKFLPEYSLGFLYMVPILMGASLFRGWQVLLTSVACGILREHFGPGSWHEGAPERIVASSVAFALGGFFVSRLNRQRLLVIQHSKQRELEAALRASAEERVRVLIDTSPLAILTIDSTGKVLLSNRSAEETFRLPGDSLRGVDVRPLVPTLGLALQSGAASGLRTTIECNAQRGDGEVFLAHIWLSTYTTSNGAELAAVIWDGSEHLRDRETTGLDSMMATSRVVIGSISHEIRNLANAALIAHRELQSTPTPSPEGSQVLGSVLSALSEIASAGLSIAATRTEPVAELGNLLNEARVLIEPPIREMGGTVVWRLPASLPLVQADQHGLLQVFLNLTRNSENAMIGCTKKQLTVECNLDGAQVIIRFADTGKGVVNPGALFAPFRSSGRSAGLGLYVSRAMLRAHGGDLRYEPGAAGSCFVIELLRARSGRPAGENADSEHSAD